jgi:hypothetical protein
VIGNIISHQKVFWCRWLSWELVLIVSRGYNFLYIILPGDYYGRIHLSSSDALNRVMSSLQSPMSAW